MPFLKEGGGKWCCEIMPGLFISHLLFKFLLVLLCDRLMWNSRSANKWGTSLYSCNMCTVFSFRLLISKARWDYRVLISRYLPFSYPFSSGLESQFVPYLRFPGWFPARMCHFSRAAKMVLPGPLKWPAHLLGRKKKLWAIIWYLMPCCHNRFIEGPTGPDFYYAKCWTIRNTIVLRRFAVEK